MILLTRKNHQKSSEWEWSISVQQKLIDHHFDVAVIGGGPAGASTALWIAKSGLSVALIERSHYQGIRVGETVHPSINFLLQDMELWERFCQDQHLPSYGNRSVWGAPSLHESHFLFSAYGTGWHLDRNKFDIMLAESAEQAGASFYSGTRILSISRCLTGKWKLSYEHGIISADFLVDAAGRASRFPSLVGAKRLIVDQLVGIGGILTPREDVVQDLFTLTETAPTGWWYSSYLPSGHLVVWFFTDTDLYKKSCILSVDEWMEGLRNTVYTRMRSSFSLDQKKLMRRSAYSGCLDQMTGEGWLVVGDSACAYDPLSSFGIQKGLQMGKKAAQAIVEYIGEKQMSTLKEYEAGVKKSFRNYLQQRIEYYGIEKRWKDSVFWQRRSVAG